MRVSILDYWYSRRRRLSFFWTRVALETGKSYEANCTLGQGTETNQMAEGKEGDAANG